MDSCPADTPAALIAAALQLRQDLAAMATQLPPGITHCYQPLDYAWAAHAAYLQRYGRASCRVLFLGMNPGPFGMVQTGVPFGEVTAVREWLGIEARIDAPAQANPARPIEGWACTRSEVSGRRLWGLFAERFGTAEAFFAEHFVANYCPLAFFAGGRNVTPDKLPQATQAFLQAACDVHLRAVTAALQPDWVIGVGAYAENCARRALAPSRADSGKAARATAPNDVADTAKPHLGRVLHPSPASPAANRGWAGAATQQLVALGIWPAAVAKECG